MVRVQTPHDDPLVVTLRVQGCDVQRVLIDGGSSANVLFWSTKKRMWLSEDQLRPNEGTKISPKGAITLTVEAADRSLLIDFVVIDAKSAYNAIMGRGWIHKMEGVASTLHQVMRCLALDGKKPVDIRGDQQMAQQCYHLAMTEEEGVEKEEKGKEKVRYRSSSCSANLSTSPGVDTDPVLVDSVDRNNYRNPAQLIHLKQLN